jgi:hypothetical protein
VRWMARSALRPWSPGRRGAGAARGFSAYLPKTIDGDGSPRRSNVPPSGGTLLRQAPPLICYSLVEAHRGRTGSDGRGQRREPVVTQWALNRLGYPVEIVGRPPRRGPRGARPSTWSVDAQLPMTVSVGEELRARDWEDPRTVFVAMVTTTPASRAQWQEAGVDSSSQAHGPGI